MSEREMRDALQRVCDNLDLKARAEAKKRGRKLVYPLMLGAGLLVVACDDETSEPQPDYAAPTGTQTGAQTGSATGAGTSTGSGSGGAGGAGATGGGVVGGGAVGGGQMDYMAPDP